MQRVIDTIQKEIDELEKAMPSEKACTMELTPHLTALRKAMLESVDNHKLVLSMVQRLLKPVPVQVRRDHRLAVAQSLGYGEIIKHNTEHWAYKFVEHGDVGVCSSETLQRAALRFAEFEASGQATAWRIGYSGGFFDGKHNTSAHADNPYEIE